jgi:hypothetical protein
VAALDERHRIRQQRLAGRLATRLEMLVATWETLAQEEVEAYHDGAYPLVAGGQREAARLAAAYGRTLGEQALGVPSLPGPTDIVGALLNSGVGVTPESRSLVAPPLRARSLVAEGATLAEAKLEAAEYAGQLGSLDLQAAQRVGLEQGVHAGGKRVVGYRKVLAGGACSWCREVGGERVYHSADSVPFHRNDACSVAPVLAEGER